MVACVVAAIAALLLGYLAAWDLYLTGFPDGHLTDYDKAVDAPKQILKWVEFGFAPLFLVLAVCPIGTRKRAVGLLAALTVLVLVANSSWSASLGISEAISVLITGSVAKSRGEARARRSQSALTMSS